MSSKWSVFLCVVVMLIVVVQCVVGYWLFSGVNPFEKLFGKRIENPPADENPSKQETKLNYVHFLDVGQGDCTLIQTADGKFIVVDASVGEAEEKILSYFEDLGVEEIEYAIFTHPHEDHIGSGDAVVDNFKVKNVIMNDKTVATSCFNRLVKAVSDSKELHSTKVFKANINDTYTVDNLKFTILSDGKLYDDLNDSSICLKFECGNNSILISGDAGQKVERDILGNGFDVSATIYKCAHHGSSTSNGTKFLDKVNPDVAVISCGKNNSYGHPHEEVELDLFSRNIPYFRTDIDGDIVIGFDEKSLVLPAA